MFASTSWPRVSGLLGDGDVLGPHEHVDHGNVLRLAQVADVEAVHEWVEPQGPLEGIDRVDVLEDVDERRERVGDEGS